MHIRYYDDDDDHRLTYPGFCFQYREMPSFSLQIMLYLRDSMIRHLLEAFFHREVWESSLVMDGLQVHVWQKWWERILSLGNERPHSLTLLLPTRIGNVCLVWCKLCAWHNLLWVWGIWVEGKEQTLKFMVEIESSPFSYSVTLSQSSYHAVFCFHIHQAIVVISLSRKQWEVNEWTHVKAYNRAR